MPNDQVQWDRKTAKHLLARTLMACSKEDLDFALSMSLSDFISNHLLVAKPAPPSPAPWADTIPLILNGPHNEVYLEELGCWYLRLLHDHSYSFQERMVLFLHNHFTTTALKVFQIQRVYQQSELIRAYVFGNLRQLTKDITIDPAMLIFLDGAMNTKDLVNENYSRELLELYTLGLGNYSEQDIKQGALALTGWTVPNDSLQSAFDPKKHYTGQVTYLGKTGQFKYDQLIDIIFEKPAAARFFCTKLCLEFVSPKPDPVFVDELAAVFSESGFEIKVLLTHLFSSPYFYAEDSYATKVKSPVDFVLSTANLFRLPITDYGLIKNFLLRMDQQLFDPPDVKGWRGQRRWINSTTYAIRNAFSYMLIYGIDLSGNNYSPALDAIEFAKTFPSHNNAVQFIDDLCDYLFHYPVSTTRKTLLLEFLTDGNNPSYWTISSENAAEKLRKLLRCALNFPEFQLH